MVQSGCRIGQMVMTGGRTKILHDIPPYLLVDGDPAQIFGINIVGLQRNGVAPEARDAIKKVYRLLYRSKISFRQAIKLIEAEIDKASEIQYFYNFLQNAKHGVILRNGKKSFD